MRAVLAFLLLAALAAPAAGADRPRVVSLDYCADQYVLALAERDQILAVSTGPEDAWSAMRAQAAGLPVLRDDAEDVIARRPDVIVRSYGGGPRARDFYRRLGFTVHELGYAASFADVRDMVRRAAAALGRPERGDRIVAKMDAALSAAADGPAGRPAALYVTPGGVTAAGGTLVHEILTAAGFENIAARGGATGWRDLPLEALVLDPPELIVTGFFDTPTQRVDNWSAVRHPVLKAQLERTPAVHLDGAHLSCGAWFMADAALQARRQADALLGEGP
ncbi:MAG: ABC transporter substrate-binding protein [Oceanicaulis sp.]